jgi:hypothetical protein
MLILNILRYVCNIKKQREVVMNKKLIGAVIFTAVMGTINVFSVDLANAETLIEPRAFRLEFTSYSSIGGGINYIYGESIPRIDVAGGFQFTPWLAMGGFISASPLSDFADADFGVSVSNEPNSYEMASGLEVLFTPWSDRLVHPLVRVTLGGINVGYGFDTDGTPHSLEGVVDERFFYTSLSGGVELNLARHIRVAGRVGYRFVGNDAYLGIKEGGLSGLEVGVTARLLWHSIIQ